MDIKILPNNLDRSHRIENPKTKKKERLIINKFLMQNLGIISLRIRIRKAVSITETLTKDPMGKLNEAKKAYGFRNVWTSDGKIQFKDEKNPSR